MTRCEYRVSGDECSLVNTADCLSERVLKLKSQLPMATESGAFVQTKLI